MLFRFMWSKKIFGIKANSNLFGSVQSLSRVRLFATPWIAALPGLPVQSSGPHFVRTLHHDLSILVGHAWKSSMLHTPSTPFFFLHVLKCPCASGVSCHRLIILLHTYTLLYSCLHAVAAAAKSLQSCPTLCDPRAISEYNLNFFNGDLIIWAQMLTIFIIALPLDTKTATL